MIYIYMWGNLLEGPADEAPELVAPDRGVMFRADVKGTIHERCSTDQVPNNIT